MGFLGVGKTTVIRHLLTQRPDNERWAVLVNEFGELGVDSRLIQGGQGATSEAVAVKQIPGGCMCCASGPLTRVALNALLRQQRPDRLLIEPSGLGHPRDIIRLLTSSEYQSVIRLEPITLILDARHVNQPRYQSHALFRDQLFVADRVVFNKVDLCTRDELQAAQDWAATRIEQSVPRHQIVQGTLPIQWLMKGDGSAGTRPEALNSAVTVHDTPLTEAMLDWRFDRPLKAGQWEEKTRSTEGFYALGWRVASDVRWRSETLLAWLSGLEVIRLKGVIPTDQGWMMINLAEGMLSAQSLGATDSLPADGVLEIIHDEALDASTWKANLSIHLV